MLKNRYEYWLIAAVTAIASSLRLWRFPDLGFVQFDEGVYALGLRAAPFLEELARYAGRHLQAPPLFFAAVDLAYRLWGVSDHAAIAASLAFGIATVVVIWRLAKGLFGAPAGAAAALLAALSNYHIAYSRMALTDVAFGFTFLLSLACIRPAYQQASLRWGVLAGLAIGAAWNTKYHGWLLLVIAAVPLARLVLDSPGDSVRWKRLLAVYACMSLVAGLCYLPWAAYVQTTVKGGYLALAKYQRGYLSRYWLKNILTQAQIQWYMDGWFSRIAPAAAFVSVVVFEKRLRSRWRIALLAAAALLACGIAISGHGTAVLLGLLGLPRLLRGRDPGGWLLAGALGVFFVLTGLYHPYGRLLMPWILTVFVVAAFGIVQLARAVCGPAPASPKLVAALAGTLAVSAAAAGFADRGVPATWRATNSFRDAAAAIAGSLPGDALVLTHGDAVIPYYLRLHGKRSVRIDEDLDVSGLIRRLGISRQSVYLICGIYSERDPRSQKTLEAMRRHSLELVRTFRVEPNDVRLLDDFSPDEARAAGAALAGEYDLKLYRWRDPFPGVPAPGAARAAARGVLSGLHSDFTR